MLIYSKANVNLPSQAADGLSAPIRLDSFGGVVTRGELSIAAEEGSFFRATNATLGTGIAMGIQTSFSATANVLFMLRSSSATKSIIPKYLRLICTATGSGTTSSRVAVALDTGNRYSSGGTDLLGQVVNSNSGVGPVSAIDVLRFGAITASAAVAAKYVANMQVKTQAAPCFTVGDEIVIQFEAGGLGHVPQNLSGAAAIKIVKHVPPIVLKGVNHCLLVHMWNPANATTAPSWEVEAGWLER